MIQSLLILSSISISILDFKLEILFALVYWIYYICLKFFIKRLISIHDFDTDINIILYLIIFIQAF